MEFKGFPPEELAEEPLDLEENIITDAKLVHAHLSWGNYTIAKVMYEDLKWSLGEVGHDTVVALVNRAGVTTDSAGWIVKAWSDSHGIKASVLEFERAWCVGAPGESISYRRSKKTWGDLVSIRVDEDAPKRVRRTDEGALRMQFYLNTNNPIRLKQTTRNELKLLLGSAAVSSAMRSKKDEFIAELGTFEARRIERITCLPIGKIWSAIRNGNQDLVDRLGMIPSAKRQQMAQRGMFVADHVEPQLTLLQTSPEGEGRRARRPAARRDMITPDDATQMALFS